MTIQDEIDKLNQIIQDSSKIITQRVSPGFSAGQKFSASVTKNQALNRSQEAQKQIDKLKTALALKPKPVIISKPTLAGPVANPPETIRPKMDSLAKGVGTSTPQKGLSNTTKALIAGGVGLVLFG